jgi:hypothetical protein
MVRPQKTRQYRLPATPFFFAPADANLLIQFTYPFIQLLVHAYSMFSAISGPLGAFSFGKLLIAFHNLISNSLTENDLENLYCAIPLLILGVGFGGGNFVSFYKYMFERIIKEYWPRILAGEWREYKRFGIWAPIIVQIGTSIWTGIHSNRQNLEKLNRYELNRIDLPLPNGLITFLVYLGVGTYIAVTALPGLPQQFDFLNKHNPHHRYIDMRELGILKDAEISDLPEADLIRLLPVSVGYHRRIYFALYLDALINGLACSASFAKSILPNDSHNIYLLVASLLPGANNTRLIYASNREAVLKEWREQLKEKNEEILAKEITDSGAELPSEGKERDEMLTLFRQERQKAFEEQKRIEEIKQIRSDENASTNSSPASSDEKSADQSPDSDDLEKPLLSRKSTSREVSRQQGSLCNRICSFFRSRRPAEEMDEMAPIDGSYIPPTIARLPSPNHSNGSV